MIDHQAGIFREGTAHHIFLEFSLPEFGTPEAPASLPGRSLALAPVPDGEQVIGFGQGLMAALGSPEASPPPALANFGVVAGGGNSAPASQRDLFIWLHGEARDELFARALAWRDALSGVARLEAEEHGFRFRDSRDLTGFVDGSANPKEDARLSVALVGAGPHAGGSFIMAQRWIHDLAGFGALPVADQERVIGRTKADSIELTGDAMPPDSHVSRTDIKRGGEAVKIYRRSSPVGGLKDAGLYFLAFSADPDRFRWLLESMYGLTADGLSDRLLGHSRPVTGSFFYAPPPSALLDAFGDGPAP
ncbi:MAG: Dyp-type peroxidase [Gammaproteobacteria bacterium]|nr:Dyp-type peroxidase [Gammaproteobacteria bacterium]